MATHSSILAWKISWTEETAEFHGVLVHPWGHKELDMTERLTLSHLLCELEQVI